MKPTLAATLSMFLANLTSGHAQTPLSSTPPVPESGVVEQGGEASEQRVFVFDRNPDPPSLPALTPQSAPACGGLPAKLYLAMHRRKEWPPGYRHAWGTQRCTPTLRERRRSLSRASTSV